MTKEPTMSHASRDFPARPREFRPSEKHARTYKSVENLKKALNKREWSHNLRYLVYRFESGRVTAVFYGSGAMYAINDKWPVVG